MNAIDLTRVEDDQLEPPGSIAILGAGPLGIEAALYGRSLGYTVTLFEADTIAPGLAQTPNAILPIPFRLCSSPLGLAALATQDPSRMLPLGDSTLLHREYIENYLLPLTQTDLLSDSVQLATRVVSLAVDPWEEPTEPDEEPLPPDFRLEVDRAGTLDSITFECVIDTNLTGPPFTGTGIAYPPGSYDPARSTQPDLATGVPYLFRIGGKSDATVSYLEGLEQIRRLFAFLFGRPSLDLYRNARY
jgi:hypothetical protein